MRRCYGWVPTKHPVHVSYGEDPSINLNDTNVQYSAV